MTTPTKPENAAGDETAKWTQEERDAACILMFSQAGMPRSSKELSDKAMDAAIELACQRNALLEALRRMDRLVTELYPGDVEPEPEHIEEYRVVWNTVMDARAAIKKATGGSQ